MRLVLDTNVVVSGVLTPAGPPDHLLDLVLAGEITLVIDPRIVAEYREVLLRPRFGLEDVHKFLEVLERIALHVRAVPWPTALEDASDEISLSTARAGAAVLVTGNMRDSPRSKRHGIVVQTPRECLERPRQ